MASLRTAGRYIASAALVAGIAIAPSIDRDVDAPANPSLRAGLHAVRGPAPGETRVVPTSERIRRTRPLEELGSERVNRDPRPLPATLAAITHELPIRARPGAGKTVGVMPAGSP